MIPEKYSLDKLEWYNDSRVIRLYIGTYYSPVLFLKVKEESWFDSDGIRIPSTITEPKFRKVYEENFEEYKAAILKLVVKQML